MYQSRPSDRRPPEAASTASDSVRARLEAVEHEQQLLRNTLVGLARDRGVSVGAACDECNRAYLLVSQGCMYCPACGYSRAI